MNNKIRSLIDEIFADMKMSAENLALRDELMANAQAHYEDAIAKGADEAAALMEVADSLGDVRALLANMNPETAKPQEPEKKTFTWSAMADDAPETPQTEKPEKKVFAWSAMEEPKAEEQPEEQPAAKEDDPFGLQDALGKAMDVLNDVGRQVVPQTRRVVRKMDKVTGGVLGDVGRAIGKGLEDMGKGLGDVAKAAEESFQKMTSGAEPEAVVTDAEAEPVSEQAADPTLEQEMEEAAGLAAEQAAQQEASEWLGADGEIDHEAFSRAVDDMIDDARDAADAAYADDECRKEKQEQGEDQADPFTVHDAKETQVVFRHPAAGLRKIDVSLDADDIIVQRGEGEMIEFVWNAGPNGGDSPVCKKDGRKLKVERPNPELFKTFFSVFEKNGGVLKISVPMGFGLSYELHTTSGTVMLSDLDAEDIETSTLSGVTKIMPEAGVRCGRVSCTTVSGRMEVDVCTAQLTAKSVSGDIHVNCDAARVDIETVSGRVNADGASDIWDLNTVSGVSQVNCTVVPTGKIEVNSVSAETRIALPSDIRGFVAEVSATGSIVNEFGPNRYGTCALPIRLDTLNGRLVITRL